MPFKVYLFYRKGAVILADNNGNEIELFGQNVQTRRQRLGLTQEKLAELCGISFEMIKSIETGRKNPSIKNLMKLCEVLGTSCDELLFGKRSNAGERQKIMTIFDELNIHWKAILIEIAKVIKNNASKY